MNRRPFIIIGAVFSFAVISAIVIIAISEHSKSNANNPAKVISVTDPDTGAVINYYPNQDKEAASQNFVLLNGEELANFLGPGQYQSVSNQIETLIQTKTGKPATIAKVMPGSVGWNLGQDVIKATIKQDNPALILTINVKLQGYGQAAVSAQ